MVIESPYAVTRPQLYHIDLDRSNVLILKLNPEKSPQESLEKIEEVFAKYNPSSPFEYQFVDEGGTRANLEELY